MNFQLTEEHEQLRKKIREFALAKIASTAAARDEESRFDRGIFREMAAFGLTGLPWTTQYDSPSLDYLSYAIAIEELARVCASTSMTLCTHSSFVSWPLHTFGTEKQKQTYFQPLVQGEKIGAYCLTEQHAGSDFNSMKTRAVKEGNEYVLNGTKQFVTNGGIADIYIVYAVTNVQSKQQKLSAFIVEPHFQGFNVGEQEKKMGTRSAPMTEIVLENCRVPKENMLGEEGQGSVITTKMFDSARVSLAAQAVGIAQGALDAAATYAKERVQFGKPIAVNQGISFKLAEMATHIEASRLLTYQAAWLETNDLPYSKESAMAKLMAADTAMRVTTEAVQILGGYGYSSDAPVERFMRDAKMTQIYGGTQEMQRLAISNML